jgi:hypothetical protein
VRGLNISKSELAQARVSLKGSNLFRYSVGKRSIVELFDDMINMKSSPEMSFSYVFHVDTQNNWPKTECSWQGLCSGCVNEFRDPRKVHLLDTDSMRRKVAWPSLF